MNPLIKFKNNLLKAYNYGDGWPSTIVIVLVVIFFVAQAFIIPTGSMRSTLLVGDGLFGKKFSYGIPIPRIPWLEVPVWPDLDDDGHLFSGSKPQRGDIVIFRYPYDDRVHYVKRNVAVGGDLLLLRNKILYIRPSEGDGYIKANWDREHREEINGLLWAKHPYKDKYPGINYDQDARLPEAVVNFGPIRVPEGEYFMMGDNRDHSSDSRFWGTVPYKHIVGTPWFIYFSYENRSYYEMLNSSDYKDIQILQKQCGKLNINDSECQKIWNKHQYSIRWDRMFTSISDF